MSTEQLERLNLARSLHEARVALAWGKHNVGKREPWPKFEDPVVLRAYPHNPIAYVDLALAQVDAIQPLLGSLRKVAEAAAEVGPALRHICQYAGTDWIGSDVRAKLVALDAALGKMPK